MNGYNNNLCPFLKLTTLWFSIIHKCSLNHPALNKEKAAQWAALTYLIDIYYFAKFIAFCSASMIA